MTTKKKIIVVIVANEYSNSTSDVRVCGAFTTYPPSQ